MKLVVSIDVEEDGLFSGRYPRVAQSVANVASLDRLEFISREFGFPLTLLATYPVVADAGACRTLERWHDARGAEVGLHLHPWNTPPFDGEGGMEWRADRVPPELIEAKIRSLQALVRERLGVAPVSFRMGRFDLTPAVLDAVASAGLGVDSSRVPLRWSERDGPAFLGPADPYLLESRIPDRAPVLEVPLTVVPLCPHAARFVWRCASALPGRGMRWLLTGFRYVGALGIHPAWFPLPSMCQAARLHRARGGQVLNVFLHSSELHPGATPQFGTEASVARLIRRLRSFLDWLVRTGPVEGVTLAGLRSSILDRQETSP